MSAVSQTVLRMPACLMKASSSAISISRPRVGPSPWAIASALTTPIGKSAAMIFQVACELINSRLSHAVCVGPRIAAAEPSALSAVRSEEHTSELQSRLHLVCRLLLEKKKKKKKTCRTKKKKKQKTNNN